MVNTKRPLTESVFVFCEQFVFDMSAKIFCVCVHVFGSQIRCHRWQGSEHTESLTESSFTFMISICSCCAIIHPLKRAHHTIMNYYHPIKNYYSCTFERTFVLLGCHMALYYSNMASLALPIGSKTIIYVHCNTQVNKVQ